MPLTATKSPPSRILGVLNAALSARIGVVMVARNCGHSTVLNDFYAGRRFLINSDVSNAQGLSLRQSRTPGEYWIINGSGPLKEAAE